MRITWRRTWRIEGPRASVDGNGGGRGGRVTGRAGLPRGIRSARLRPDRRHRRRGRPDAAGGPAARAGGPPRRTAVRGRVGAARRIRPGRPRVAGRGRGPRTGRGDRPGRRRARPGPPRTTRLVRQSRPRPEDARRLDRVSGLRPRPARRPGRQRRGGRRMDRRWRQSCLRGNRFQPLRVPSSRVGGPGPTGVVPAVGPFPPAATPGSPSTTTASSPTGWNAPAPRSSTPRWQPPSSPRPSRSANCAPSTRRCGAPRCTPGNFHRKILSVPGFVESTGATDTRPGSRGGPRARLYRAGDARLLHPALLRPDREAGDTVTAARPSPSTFDDALAAAAARPSRRPRRGRPQLPAARPPAAPRRRPARPRPSRPPPPSPASPPPGTTAKRRSPARGSATSSVRRWPPATSRTCAPPATTTTVSAARPY